MAHITLVKKVTAEGLPCRKCRDVQERLEREGLLDAIDRVVVADERDPGSEGWELARRHGVERAPFFVVRENGEERVYTVYFRFVREVLGAGRDDGRPPLDELMELGAEVDFI
ncbi:MAG: hypothetical protein Kow006_07250 [Gammaproteobacteria bacterium]